MRNIKSCICASRTHAHACLTKSTLNRAYLPVLLRRYLTKIYVQSRVGIYGKQDSRMSLMSRDVSSRTSSPIAFFVGTLVLCDALYGEIDMRSVSRIEPKSFYRFGDRAVYLPRLFARDS